jgi:hypothetical protein
MIAMVRLVFARLPLDTTKHHRTVFSAFCILHSAFCILHLPLRRTPRDSTDGQ